MFIYYIEMSILWLKHTYSKAMIIHVQNNILSLKKKSNFTYLKIARLLTNKNVISVKQHTFTTMHFTWSLVEERRAQS